MLHSLLIASVLLLQSVLSPLFGELAKSSGGRVGVFATVINAAGPDDHAELNASERFPMQSVYKVPIVMAVLDQVDRKALTLNQKISLTEKDMVPAAAHSPMRDRYPRGGIDVSIRDLIRAAIADSDGTASDVLLRVAGGGPRVTAYLRGLGIRDMAVATSEADMTRDDMVQYKNYSTPQAAVELLKALSYGTDAHAGVAPGRARRPGRVHSGCETAEGTASARDCRGPQDRDRWHARRPYPRHERHRAGDAARRTATRDRGLHQGFDRRRGRAGSHDREDRPRRVGSLGAGAAMSSDRQRLEAIAEDAMRDTVSTPTSRRRPGAASGAPRAAPTRRTACAICATCRGRRSTTTTRAISISSTVAETLPDGRRECSSQSPTSTPGAARTRRSIATPRTNTTSVYTPARIFPMLPRELSTDLTRSTQDVERPRSSSSMDVDADGALRRRPDVYRALVRNHAKLAYEAVGAWLDGARPAAPAARARRGLDAQLRLQDGVAQALRARRARAGRARLRALEAAAVVDGDGVKDLRTGPRTARSELIENFMVAANGVDRAVPDARGFASIRRVVKSPERWPRIVELAAAARRRRCRPSPMRARSQRSCRRDAAPRPTRSRSCRSR